MKSVGYKEVSNNPIENGEMRSGMMPSMITSLQHDKKVFEIGEIFRACKGENTPSKKLALGVGTTESYSSLKKVIKDMLSQLGLSVEYKISTDGKYPYLEPEFNTIVMVGDKVIGPLGVVRGKNIVVCSLIIDFIEALKKPQ